MTRSIFDPTGGETERSGSTFLGPEARNISHMPPDAVDGAVTPEEALEAGEPTAKVPPDVSDLTRKIESAQSEAKSD